MILDLRDRVSEIFVISDSSCHQSVVFTNSHKTMKTLDLSILTLLYLISFDIYFLQDRLMNFPVWIDLKGQDSVPDTVHHVVCRVNPVTMTMWKNLTNHWETDAVHCNDIMNTNQPSKGIVHLYVFVLLWA